MASIYLHQIETKEMAHAKDLKDHLDVALRDYKGEIWLIPSIDSKNNSPAKDVDLLMIGYLDNYHMDINIYNNIHIVNFITTIEIKSLGPECIAVDGTHLFVAYPNEKKDVTIQSNNQKITIQKFIENNFPNHNIPYISNLIWLRGIDDDFLSEINFTNSNVISCKPDITKIFQAIGRQTPLRPNGFIKAFKNHKVDDIKAVADLFCAKRQGADKMTLKRISLLKDPTTESAINQQLSTNTGTIVLSGHAGTGKTIQLLRAAHLMSQKGHKCLFLTYNKALISDLKHTMRYLNMQKDLFEMTTMHSYFISIMRFFKIWDNRCDINRDFNNKIEILNLNKERLTLPNNKQYKYVFIDEAQDWNEFASEVIRHYHSHIVIADGIDQFMLSNNHTNWGEPSIPKLRKCLRQRRNLTLFVKNFASKLNIHWDVQANDELPGGKVIICYQYTKDLHNKLKEEAEKHDCTPYDIMLLAPVSLASSGRFDLYDRYKENGINLFDGINENNKDKIYDISNYTNEESRVYTYESCRGLEAWTTICLRFDKLFNSDHPHDYKDIKHKAARNYMLGLWSLIPLTRAVNTLVLCVTENSEIDIILKEIVKEAPDYVEYYNN